MTGHDDCDGIPVVGHPDCAKSLRTAYRTSNVRISPRFAIRNREQSPPARYLELRPPKIKRKTELPAVPREILLQFLYKLAIFPSALSKQRPLTSARKSR